MLVLDQAYITTPWSKYRYLHFTDEESKILRV